MSDDTHQQADGTDFPEGFLWGAATASHQVEGDNRGNDWWCWEKTSGKIRDDTTSGAAAGWWDGKAEQDLAVAADMGHNAHRFSLEWSRIEPEKGRFDETALERYAEILGAAKTLGMTTCVTLSHFTLPLWQADAGGWLDGDIVRRFTAFVGKAVPALDKHVDLWVTLNEPNVLAYSAYAGDLWPPGTKSIKACFKALRRQMRAHAAGYREAKKHTTKPVGLVLNTPLFEPHRPDHMHDRLARGFQDWTFSGLLIESLLDGKIRFPLNLWPRRVPGLAGAYDFIGVNYYGRFEVQFDLKAETPLGRHVQNPTTRTEQTDWGQTCSRGLAEQLERVARRLDTPVYVTENGLYDNTDTLRPRFLVEHVGAVAEALRKGVDVRGYFHWSLVDNFEWAEGWSTHFGLLELDRETGERTPRRTAEIYAEICRSNGRLPDLDTL